MEHDAVIIEVGLNEAVSPAVHPHVPQRPLECAADARRCADAGATIVHWHAVDDDGRAATRRHGAVRRGARRDRRLRARIPVVPDRRARHRRRPDRALSRAAPAARDGDRAGRCRVGQRRRGRRRRARRRAARARARIRRHPQLAAVRRRRARELPRGGARRDGRRVRPRLDPRDRRARAGRAPRPAGAVQDLLVGVAADRSPSRASKRSISTCASSRPTSTSSGSSSPTG